MTTGAEQARLLLRQGLAGGGDPPRSEGLDGHAEATAGCAQAFGLGGADGAEDIERDRGLACGVDYAEAIWSADAYTQEIL